MKNKAFISFEYDNQEDLEHILDNITTVMRKELLAPFSFPLFKAGAEAVQAGLVEVFEID
jgi:hypothetical protein